MVKLCYLLGHPVEHSMSGVMYNSAFEELSMEYRFETLRVPPSALEGVLSELRAPWVRGASVTIPHKIEALRYLDHLDQVASRVGAVNTIVNSRGILRGYNTDGVGAMRALEEAFGDLRGVRAVVLGAGGASRAISYKLSMVADELTIINRTFERAQGVVEALRRFPEGRASLKARPLNRAHLRPSLREAELLVNATSVGMWPRVDETPVDGDLLRPGMMVFDIVYNPPRTRLLKEAEMAGAKTLNGLGMLVYQGAEAFRLWTGREAPTGVMRRAVEEALEARR